MAVSPIQAAQRLRGAAVDGRLEALAGVHGLSLVVMFGSASRDQDEGQRAAAGHRMDATPGSGADGGESITPRRLDPPIVRLHAAQW
ncbi:MAG: hypothetical protein ACT4NY_20405 [Pseudonocardiales bacterium]